MYLNMTRDDDLPSDITVYTINNIVGIILAVGLA